LQSASVWTSRLEPFCAALASALSNRPRQSSLCIDGDPGPDETPHHVGQHLGAIAKTTIIDHISVSPLRLVSTRSDMLNRSTGSRKRKQVHCEENIRYRHDIAFDRIGRAQRVAKLVAPVGF